MDMKDLMNPAFLEFVREQFPDSPVRPDAQDYDSGAIARTNEEAAGLYREAQARKLMRMYKQWEASLN
jgi:hypothetical protein